MKSSFLALALLPLAVLAQPAPLLDITDPEGDDVGEGSLVYPRASAYKPGDLDLRSLRVYTEGKDLRFEATFRNPIRDPASVMSPGMGSESLSYFARRGFYAFNLDIYLDTDRVPGSGNAVTLPGRRAMLDPAHAWEKAIVLTPRPELMKRQFIASLRETSSAGEADVNATVERSVFFPTQIRVRGRTVSFIVPGTFIDAAGLTGASITAIVTAATLSVDAGLNMTLGDTGPRERFALGVAQPDVGEPEFTMGYRSAPAPATSVVDVLSPDPRQQPAQLARGGLLTGLNRENKYGAAPAITPVAPTASVAPAASAAGGSWFSSALDSLSGLFGAGSAAPTTPSPAAAAGTPQSVQSLMATPAAPVAAPAPAAVPAPARTAAPAAPQVAAPAAVPAPARTAAPAAPQVAAPAAVPAPARAAAPAAPQVAAPAATAAAAAAAAAATAPAAAVPARAAPAAAAPAAAAPAAAASAPRRARDAASLEEQELRLRTLKRLRDAELITEQEYQQKRKEVLEQL